MAKKKRANLIERKEPMREIWAVGINLVGMWGPYKMHLGEYFTEIGESPRWCGGPDEDFDVTGLGLIIDKNTDIITFADPDKEKVELFFKGAKAMAQRFEDFLAGVLT
jgi:hypothetical protein